MKVLSAENNISYTANNAIKIYIIKQVDLDKISSFEDIYAPIIKDGTKSNAAINLNNFIKSEKNIQLTKLSCPKISGKLNGENENLYTKFDFKSFDSNETRDFPYYPIKQRQNDGKEGIIPYYCDCLWFLTSLIQLRNCPLLDLNKQSYVFQIEGQATGGLANVISFSTNFNVNGQSSAEIVLNNKDFLYNFKYFGDKDKYNLHLKSYFDTDDIIIIRYQKRNNESDNLLNSFKPSSINYYEDLYKDSSTDPFTTIFTGYINNINDSFSFNNGQQTVTLSCTGPSKKLTWKRFVTQQAPGSRDSYSAIIPLSAYINPQTRNENNKTPISNEDVVKNVIVRTYSGITNSFQLKLIYDRFTNAFDEANTVKTDLETKELRDKINKLSIKQNLNKITVSEQKQLQNLQQQLNEKISALRKKAWQLRDAYDKLINTYFNEYVKTNENSIKIIKHAFLKEDDFGECPTLFEIKGTQQPSYQWAFQNFSSLFQSDYSTVYQFIKTIADNLQFNFYDDPYGTIHFEIPNLTLRHLYKETDANNLSQILSFTETENTENIANIQSANAKYIYNMPMDMINTVIKDYRSIEKYGEKMMQPFEMVGLTDISAIRYAAKMKMAKYNRKALSNIRVNMYGNPNIQLGKYAYIKSLRKLFYIESYSHSYNAGGDFTTSLNGTYTRDILAIAKMNDENQKRNISRIFGEIPFQGATSEINSVYNKRLSNADSNEDILKLLQELDFGKTKEELVNLIYQIYIDNWNYPANNADLKLEIGAMYNEDSLRECYLDDFLWAIPFDADPYAIAKQIQDEEQKLKAQLAKTEKAKIASKKKINKSIIYEQNHKLPQTSSYVETVKSVGTTGGTVTGIMELDLNAIKDLNILSNIPKYEEVEISLKDIKTIKLFDEEK